MRRVSCEESKLSSTGLTTVRLFYANSFTLSLSVCPTVLCICPSWWITDCQESSQLFRPYLSLPASLSLSLSAISLLLRTKMAHKRRSGKLHVAQLGLLPAKQLWSAGYSHSKHCFTDSHQPYQNRSGFAIDRAKAILLGQLNHCIRPRCRFSFEIVSLKCS